MTRAEIGLFTGILVVMGAGWGLTQPLSKIAVSTGYQPFGLIFWQLVIGALCLGPVSFLRGRGLPLGPGALRTYLVIALVGTLIPNTAGYHAITHLPAGVVSVLMSLIPLATFPMALALGLEPFRWRSLMGLLAGLGGVLLLVVPEASLPEAVVLAWLPVCLIAVLCYAFEGNYVARWGTAGIDAIGVLFGASLLGAVLTLPLALASGQFIPILRPWGAPDWALVASSLIHAVIYAVYVWLVGRTGPVFSVQVSYLVTGFGVTWSMLVLGESYSPWFWAAMVLILTGVAMVQPRRKEPVAPPSAIGDGGG